ncbi:MAG: hypothetical protein KKC84_03935 [Candidatus Omnitrophica bacterium]|nr:hypothetical protein [Candidatus Omnitrophota bacterium]
MFVHAVHFQVLPKEVAKYRKDSLMWAAHAEKASGFVSYSTFKRQGFKNHYISCYIWKAMKEHDRFMKKHHDWLVAQSKAKVKVLGYYNLKSLDSIRGRSPRSHPY